MSHLAGSFERVKQNHFFEDVILIQRLLQRVLLVEFISMGIKLPNMRCTHAVGCIFFLQALCAVYETFMHEFLGGRKMAIYWQNNLQKKSE